MPKWQVVKLTFFAPCIGGHWVLLEQRPIHHRVDQLQYAVIKLHIVWLYSIMVFAPCKAIQDRFQIPVLDSGFFVSGTEIPDSNR